MEIPDLPLGEEGDSFQTVMAILIAVVTLVGAVVAWRGAVAGNNAGDADFAGLQAALNAEQTRLLSNAEFFRHYRAYTAYARHNELQEQIGADQEFTPVAELDRQQAEASDLATTSRLFFPTRYLNRDGSYAIQQELGEVWAEAAQSMDLDPVPHFIEGDEMRVKTNWLVAIFIPLCLALLFYTLAEGLHPERRSLRYGMATAGTACLILTVIAAFVIEVAL